MKDNENTNNWKDTLCSQTGRINIVKMIIPIKIINKTPTKKRPMIFFAEL